ncbi:MAG: SpoIID/LytB domain-containing protein [Candidatus Omnitrophota bacterium]
MRYLAVLLIIACLLAPVFPECGYSATGVTIRVCVAKGEDDVLLGIRGFYTIKAINSDLVLEEGRYLRKECVTPTSSGLKLGKKEFKIYGIRIIPKKDSSIYIDKRRFRGIVDILRTKDLKLMVVNHLDLEKYLYGVLRHEVPHYWPMEALKAQAIAARTFALYRIETMRDKDYDVTSDIYSQVYGGRSGEHWRTTRAVKSTRGKVLVYKGKILPAYYHSICGGHTEDAEKVFGISLAPLKGRRCLFCGGAKGMHWKAKLSYKQIEERLNKYGIKVKDMSFIAPGKRDKSGRLETIKVKDSGGEKEIPGFKFRLAVGPNVIRSTNFTIKISKSGVIFSGRGWGHGVGMCQWGAFGMAKRRFNYKKILEYYYPGAKIVKYGDRSQLSGIVSGGDLSP